MQGLPRGHLPYYTGLQHGSEGEVNPGTWRGIFHPFTLTYNYRGYTVLWAWLMQWILFFYLNLISTCCCLQCSLQISAIWENCACMFLYHTHKILCVSSKLHTCAKVFKEKVYSSKPMDLLAVETWKKMVKNILESYKSLHKWPFSSMNNLIPTSLHLTESLGQWQGIFHWYLVDQQRRKPRRNKKWICQSVSIKNQHLGAEMEGHFIAWPGDGPDIMTISSQLVLQRWGPIHLFQNTGSLLSWDIGCGLL